MSNKPLLVIFLTVFIDLVGFGIIIPMSPYLARQFGASPFEVGLLMAVYSGMQFIISPLWGQISDRVGRRPILLLSILGTACAHLLFYFSPTLIWLFVARILAGIFSANISTATAYIADVTDVKSRSKNMGLIGMAFGLGFVLGPALGGVTTAWGESFPALVAALISFVNFISAYFILHESLPPEKRQPRVKKSRLKNIFEKIKRPIVGPLLLAQFAFSLAMANMEAVFFLFVQDRFQWTMQKASFGFAYVGICIAFTQGFLVRKLLPKWGERVMLVAGFSFFSVGMFTIGSSLWVGLLAVAVTVLALGNGFISPALSGGISLLTPAHEQGEVIGVNHSLAALARILGPMMGGYVYMHIGIISPFMFAGVIGLVGLFSVFSVYSKIPNDGKQS